MAIEFSKTHRIGFGRLLEFEVEAGSIDDQKGFTYKSSVEAIESRRKTGGIANKLITVEYKGEEVVLTQQQAADRGLEEVPSRIYYSLVPECE